jgi:hypothetical protein
MHCILLSSNHHATKMECVVAIALLPFTHAEVVILGTAWVAGTFVFNKIAYSRPEDIEISQHPA